MGTRRFESFGRRLWSAAQVAGVHPRGFGHCLRPGLSALAEATEEGTRLQLAYWGDPCDGYTLRVEEMFLVHSDIPCPTKASTRQGSGGAVMHVNPRYPLYFGL